MRVSFPVKAPPAAWAALSDPQRLAAALPGCRSVARGAGGTGDRVGDDSRIGDDPAAYAAGSGAGPLHVVTEVAVASVRGLWAGTVERVDAGAGIAGADAGGAGIAGADAGGERTSAVGDAVRVRGSGTPGTVDVVVRVDPDRTAVTVEGTVEGPLATVGSSVLAAAIRRMAEDLLAAAAAPADPGRLAGAAVPADPSTTGNLTVDLVDTHPDVRRRRRLLVLAGALVLGGATALVGRLVRRGAA